MDDPLVKRVGIERAISAVLDGMRVGVGGGAATPQVLLSALAAALPGLRDVTVVSGPLLGTDYSFLGAGAEHLSYETWFVPTAFTGTVVDVNAVRHLPLSWYQACQYLEARPVDVALVQVSAPIGGKVSLGVSSGYVLPMLESARHVIAEVNSRMPYTFGSSEISVDAIDAFVDVGYELPQLEYRPPTATDTAIVELCAERLKQCSAVQLGIGAIPSMVLGELARDGFRGSVHSVLNDGFLELAARRADNEGGPIAFVGEIVGTTELYDLVHRNPLVEMLSGLRTHSPRVLTGYDGLGFLNSGMEVDLYGQVNSEFRGDELVGGAGGLVDFTAASIPLDAVSIVALPSSTSRGRSRIVPVLAGVPASAFRFGARTVVTEHGRADLALLTSHERALALIDIADPAARRGLRDHLQRHRPLFGAQ